MLAKRLKAARQSKNWTQGQLGQKVNTTKGTISNYENSHSTPSNEMLLLLASALDVTVDYLLGNSVDSTRTIRGEQVDISNLSEKQRTVLDWIMSRESFQTVDNKDDLTKLLDEVGVIYDLIHKRGE